LKTRIVAERIDAANYMGALLEALLVALRSIRDQADSVLSEMDKRAEQRSLSWKCTRC